MTKVALTFLVCLILSMLTIIHIDVEWKAEYTQYAEAKCAANDGVKHMSVDMTDHLSITCGNGAEFYHSDARDLVKGK